MAVYLITYDLNKPGQNYNDLYETIKSYGNWIHPLDSTWLIATNQSAKNVYDTLAIHLDSSDKILIIEVKGHWHASLTKDDYAWLRSNLT